MRNSPSLSNGSLKSDQAIPLVKETPHLFRYGKQKDNSSLVMHDPGNIFRLSVKNCEYIYARPDDIIMIESCDHLVKVYVAGEGKCKLTVRRTTLKDFLLQLPTDQFIRIGRFCAVNIHRLSGGNCTEQTFEFDFKISLKLKHPIPRSVFANIGK